VLGVFFARWGMDQAAEAANQFENDGTLRTSALRVPGAGFTRTEVGKPYLPSSLMSTRLEVVRKLYSHLVSVCPLQAYIGLIIRDILS